MRICLLAAGAGGMYCGSCLRDNALAGALMRAGHQVVLIPLYTPLRTDTPGVGISEVFYGGINAWLQYATGFFRHTPRALDWLLDRPWLLKMAGAYGAQTSPAKLGPFILSILEGEEGPQIKELRRLAKFVAKDVRPEVISLPNLMFIGMAKLLGEETGAPVVCELTGEDIFLEAMAEPFRSEARRAIQNRCVDVAKFVATSGYYADRMAEYLGVPRERIEVVYPGVLREEALGGSGEGAGDRGVVGYLARVCPEKGLDRLVEVLRMIREMPGLGGTRVRAAGYLGAAHREWFEGVRRTVASAGLERAFEYVGEVDLAGKLAFLDSVDVLCVPTAYAEPKGIYVLEAMARGVPVVQPGHGAFPELVGMTGGGVVAPADDLQAIAEAAAGLLREPGRRRELGKKGREAVLADFTDDRMAARMLKVYQDVQHGRYGSTDFSGIAGERAG